MTFYGTQEENTRAGERLGLVSDATVRLEAELGYLTHMERTGIADYDQIQAAKAKIVEAQEALAAVATGPTAGDSRETEDAE